MAVVVVLVVAAVVVECCGGSGSCGCGDGGSRVLWWQW